MAKSKAHPGFKAVQNQIAKREGVSKKQAGAILAAATRRASPAAKRKNPRLNRVKGQKMEKENIVEETKETQVEEQVAPVAAPEESKQ